MFRCRVTQITIYAVNYGRDVCLPNIEEARKGLFADHKPADVVVGVASLSPDHLIEIDAIAVIGHTTESCSRTS